MKKIFLSFVILIYIFLCIPILANDSKVLSWNLMSELDVNTGEMPDELRKLNGGVIEITGFIVPLEMDEYIDKVTEFLLVPDPFSCIHVPPPPLNQMVLVSMKKAISLDMDFRGVTIRGKLSISPHEYDTKLTSFKISGHSAKEAEIDMQDFFSPDMI